MTRRISLPKWAATAAALLAATGCEKVVDDLKLNTTAANIVIEANLVDDGRPCQVSLVTSVNYRETNAFPPITGAKITLADDAGALETLRETSPGQYVGESIRGLPGRTYILRVETGGGAYVANSTLPPVVPFDALTAETNSAGFDKEIQAVVSYVDPPGLGNSYLFRQYRNGRLNPALFAQNDKFTDGRAQRAPLRNFMGSNAKEADLLVSGDSLTVEMLTIDPAVYEYFRTLNQILSSNPAFATTPANPTSNFSGGALGYFSAHSRQVRRVRVP